MEILNAIGFIAGLCITLALILAVTNRRLRVIEDPRIDDVEELLPGTNCGACGVPGCRVFAEKSVAGEIQPSACTVGGPENAAIIADYLGVAAGEALKKVARLLCYGSNDVAIQAAAYEGFSSCRATASVAGGAKGCTYGCLGFGDCERVCSFNAIRMSANGLPVVDWKLCTACNDCVIECPKNLFVLLPVAQMLLVQCKSELAGDELKELCRVACTGCGICVADAPAGLLHMKNNLPVFEPDLTDIQTEKATLRCPTGAIVWLGAEQQFPDLFTEAVTEGRG